MNLGIDALRVLVTAGANGIGLSIAKAFENEGAKVHICDVDDRALIELAGANPRVTATKTDVSDRKQVRSNCPPPTISTLFCSAQ